MRRRLGPVFGLLLLAPFVGEFLLGNMTADAFLFVPLYGCGAVLVRELAAGAIMTYLWASFPLRPELGGSLALDLATNAACALVAFTVLGLAWRSIRRCTDEPSAVPL